MNGYMIVDMQFGSTGKGLLAGYLAMQREPDVIVTAWGPNAGHTYIDESGHTYIHTMLANGIVSPKCETVLIGPGSVVDIDALVAEIAALPEHILARPIEVVIHPNAAWVTQEHRDREKYGPGSMERIGSTMKGTGAAIADKVARKREAVAGYCMKAIYGTDRIHLHNIRLICSRPLYEKALDNARLVQIEGAQGHSLSLYGRFYPYCTSRDISPHQILADCAIPYNSHIDVYGTMRTYPIRVANRFRDGEQVGYSGDHYPDQSEIQFADIGQEVELTTVTKLPRRLFTFSMEQTREAIRMFSPKAIFLNFCNYLEKLEPGEDEDVNAEVCTNLVDDLIGEIESEGVIVQWAGWGPRHTDVEER